MYYDCWCINHSPITSPGSCLNGSSSIVYDKNGMFSADSTFMNCLDNVDQASMPSYYNGTYNGCLMMFTTVTLLNLVEVNIPYCSLSLSISFLLHCFYCVFFMFFSPWFV